MDFNAVVGLNQKQTCPVGLFPSGGNGSCLTAMQGQGPSNIMDNVNVSETARQAFLEEQNNDPFAQDLEERFRLALVEFSNFALQINGCISQATPMHGFYALAELAHRSGIEMPGNLTEGKAELLQEFKEKWGLDDNSSVEDILAKMKEVFDNDQSYITHIPTLDQTEPPPDLSVGNEEVAPPVSDDPYRQALVDFTAKLFDRNNIEREPGGKDYDRVIDALSEKLGIPFSSMGFDLQAVAEAMNLPDDASVNDIIQNMERIFYS